MHHQKGHSLFEVLIALILLAVFSLMWLKQEIFSKKLLTQLIMLSSGSTFLNAVDELLLAPSNQFPSPPPAYQFVIQRKSQQFLLKLKPKSGFKELTRSYTYKSFTS